MEQKKGFLSAFVLFLVFSSVLSCVAAVPATRSLKSTQKNPSSIQDFLPQEAMEVGGTEGDMVEFIEGRINLESTDYPGTGANNHHEPRSPGRA